VAVRAGAADERQAVEALLRQLDFADEELRLIDTEFGKVGLRRPEVPRLMTIPGSRRPLRYSQRSCGRLLIVRPHNYFDAKSFAASRQEFRQPSYQPVQVWPAVMAIRPGTGSPYGA